MPNNSLIDLFLAYGPQPDGNAMYDEFVLAEAKNAGHDPLRIEEGVSKGVVEDLTGDEPISIILTGTAGDGKTFTARAAFGQIDQGTWDSSAVENELTLRSGRKVTFLKDLSELSHDEREVWFPRLTDALLGKSEDRFVVCVNDGQLLSFFRQHAGDPRADELLSRLTQMLQNEVGRPPEGLPFRLIHMSRKSHAETVEQIFDVILEHDGWSDCPPECPALQGVNPCPIRLNREVLRGNDRIFQQRVRDAVEIAAADDRHLALRQLIIVVTNTLLGDAKGRKSKLMTCRRAQQISEDGDYGSTNPYSNALGYNHSDARRQAIGVFDTLSRLGIGDETTNSFDDALLDEEGLEALPRDDIYGKGIFAEPRASYAENPSENAGSIRLALKAQRRRLFFTLPKGRASAIGDPWCLTRFHFGQVYLDLLRDLEQDERSPGEVARSITRGLNRTLTGYLTETDDAIWLTRPRGEAHGRSVALLVDQPIRWDGRHTRACIDRPAALGRPPVLSIAERGEVYGRLALTPTMFEFLSRVADGAIPGSFGSQCLQEIRTFQISTAGSLERAYAVNGEQVQLQAIRLRTSDGALEQHPIRLLEASL